MRWVGWRMEFWWIWLLEVGLAESDPAFLAQPARFDQSAFSSTRPERVRAQDCGQHQMLEYLSLLILAQSAANMALKCSAIDDCVFRHVLDSLSQHPFHQCHIVMVDLTRDKLPVRDGIPCRSVYATLMPTILPVPFTSGYICVPISMDACVRDVTH